MFFPFHDNNPTHRFPAMTVLLIVMNCLSFLWMVQLPAADQQDVVLQRGFIPARIAQLQHGRPIVIQVAAEPAHLPEAPGAQVEQLDPVPRQIYASLITCMFMHGGWLHLLGNMWFLWLFGNNVEDRLGAFLFTLFYLAGGLIATFCHYATDPGSGIPIIGASGAVSAILGAYAITWPGARVKTLIFLVVFVTIVELPALLVLGLWFGQQLLEATLLDVGMNGGVAFWAHIGGFVAGFVAMPLFNLVKAPPQPWDGQTVGSWQ